MVKARPGEIFDDSGRPVTASKLVRTEPPSPKARLRPNWVGRQDELGRLHESARKIAVATPAKRPCAIETDVEPRSNDKRRTRYRWWLRSVEASGAVK